MKNNIEVMISFISVEGIFLIGNKKFLKYIPCGMIRQSSLIVGLKDP
ncbi:MAG: hypothetical protein ACLTTH_15835 [Holdemanella porci]